MTETTPITRDPEEDLDVSVTSRGSYRPIQNKYAEMRYRLALSPHEVKPTYNITDAASAGAVTYGINRALEHAAAGSDVINPAFTHLGAPIMRARKDIAITQKYGHRTKKGRNIGPQVLPYFRAEAKADPPSLPRYWKIADKIWEDSTAHGKSWVDKTSGFIRSNVVRGAAIGLIIPATLGWATKKVTSGWVVEAMTKPSYSPETRAYFDNIRSLQDHPSEREAKQIRKHGLHQAALSKTIASMVDDPHDAGAVAVAAAKIAKSAVRSYYVAHGDKSGFGQHEYYGIQDLAGETAVQKLEALGSKLKANSKELAQISDRLRRERATLSVADREALEARKHELETTIKNDSGSYAEAEQLENTAVLSVREEGVRRGVIRAANVIGSFASVTLGYWATGLFHRLMTAPNETRQELVDVVHQRQRDMQRLLQSRLSPQATSDPEITVQPSHGHTPQAHDDILQADAPPNHPHVEAQVVQEAPDPRLLEYKYLRPEDIPPVTDIDGNRLPMHIPLRSISRPLTHDPRGDVFSHLTKYPQVQTLYMKDDSGTEIAVPGTQAAIIIDDVTPEASRRLPTLFGTHDPNQVHIFRTSKDLLVIDEHSGTFRADLLTPHGLVKKVRVPRLMDGFRFKFEGGGWNPDGSYQEGSDLYPTMTVEETRQRIQEFKGYKFFDPVLREWRVVTDVKFNLYSDVYEPGKVVFDPNNPTDPDNYWQQYGNMNEPDTVAYTFCGWQRQGQVGVPDSMRYSANRYVVITRAVSNQTAAVPDTSIVRTSTTRGDLLYGQFPKRKRPGEEDTLAA